MRANGGSKESDRHKTQIQAEVTYFKRSRSTSTALRVWMIRITVLTVVCHDDVVKIVVLRRGRVGGGGGGQ